MLQPLSCNQTRRLRHPLATCPPVQEPLLLWTLVGVVAGVVLGVALKPAGLGPQVRLPGWGSGHACFLLQQSSRRAYAPRCLKP